MVIDMPRCKFLKEKKNWVAEIHNIPPNKFNIYNMTDVKKKKKIQQYPNKTSTRISSNQ